MRSIPENQVLFFQKDVLGILSHFTKKFPSCKQHCRFEALQFSISNFIMFVIFEVICCFDNYIIFCPFLLTTESFVGFVKCATLDKPLQNNISISVLQY